MPASNFLGTREPLSLSAHDSTDMNLTSLPLPSAACSNSYESPPLSDNQYATLDDGGFSSRGHTLSAGGGGGFGPGGMGYAGIVGDPYHHRPGGHATIKFRRKGVTHSGISVSEALEMARLSQGNTYLMLEIAPDIYGKILLKVRVRLLFSSLVPLISLVTDGTR